MTGKVQVQHGAKVYESVTAAAKAIGIERKALNKILKESDMGKVQKLLGETITRVSVPTVAPECRELPQGIRRGKRPPLLPGLCTHRLGVYLGGRW